MVKMVTYGRKKMKKYIKDLKIFLLQNFKWIILFFSIVFFLILLEDVMDKDIMTIDTKGYTFVSTYLISDFTIPIAKTITNLGGAYWLIGISICLLLLIKNKKVGISVLLNLILASLTNYILKQILQRPRPIEYRIIDEKWI